jgi:hypothetical protein
MRRSPLVRLLLATFLSTLILSSRAEAQKNHFMRLTNPQDTQRYGPGATCVVMGLLQSPDSETDVESVLLRLRVFRPGEQGFVVANEAGTSLKKALTAVKKLATGGRLYTFEARVKLPVEQGQYLLRVDCLDRKTAKYPENLIATQSLFIDVPVTPKAKASPACSRTLR